MLKKVAPFSIAALALVLALSVPPAWGQAPAAAPEPAPAANGFADGFAATTRNLDRGGEFFLYMNVKDGLRQSVNELKTLTATPGLPPQVTMGVGFGDRILDLLGLYGIEDLGVSAVKTTDNRARTKIVIRAPQEHKGVFKIFGGAPHAFESLKYAPPDADVFRSFDFSAAEALALARDAAQQLGGVAGVTQLNARLAKLDAKLGISIEGVIQALGGEFAVVVELDRATTTAFNVGRGGTLALPAPRVAILARAKDSSVYQALLTLLTKGGVEMQDAAESGVGAPGALLKATAKDAAEAIGGGRLVVPAVAFDGTYAIFATHPALLDKVLATGKGGPNLGGRDEFKALLAGLPDTGNGLAWVSPRAMATVQSLLSTALSPQEQQSFIRILGPAIVLPLVATSVPPTGFTAVHVNAPDGIQLVANTPSGLTGVALLGLTVPLLARGLELTPPAGVRAKVSRVRADQRSLATALEAFYVDHSKYPDWATGAESANRDPAMPSLKNAAVNANPPSPSLTTPVAYITRLPEDPFAEPGKTSAYYSVKNGWIVWSKGPDGDYDLDQDNIKTLYDPSVPQPSLQLLLLAYDPTNGTRSSGDVFRVKQ